jgi:hypothetical protein
MFRITQDPSSGSIDSYLIKTTRNGSTLLVVCAVGVIQQAEASRRTKKVDRARTHTTGPEYPAKHRHRTQQALLNHCA